MKWPWSKKGEIETSTKNGDVSPNDADSKDLGIVSIVQELRKRQSDLTEAERLVLAVNDFEEGVNGEGFSGYFWNSKGEHLDQLPSYLKEIGEPEVAELLVKAIQVAGLKPPFDSDVVEAALEDLSEESEDMLGDLDTAYFSAGYSLEEALLAFVEAHQSEIGVIS